MKRFHPNLISYFVSALRISYEKSILSSRPNETFPASTLLNADVIKKERKKERAVTEELNLTEKGEELSFGAH